MKTLINKTAKTLLLLLFFFTFNKLVAQPIYIHHNMSGSWTVAPGDILTDRGVVKIKRILASGTATREFLFNDNSNWWKAPDANPITKNQINIASTLNSENINISATDAYYYTFIAEDNGGFTANVNYSVLETVYNPNTISSVSRNYANPDNSQVVTVTATLSGVLNAAEYAYVRYTTDNWSSSNLVSMSFVSGTDYSADIPAQNSEVTVQYYVLTSNLASFTASEADYFSLEINNNAGANYSYTVYYSTAQDGDWNIAATWIGNSVPPVNANTRINHAVTVNAVVVDNPAITEISVGNSLTFGASGDITVNSSVNNAGTIDMTSGGLFSFADASSFTNSATFSGGSGKVIFLGAGTHTGITTFNDIEVQGAVDLGASASLSGTYIINGGWLINNSITYNSGSILKYATNYNISSGDKSWYSNIVSSGSAQEGIPWNVLIPAGITVILNDSYPFSINGGITIDGSFTLGTDGGTHWGDLFLRGDFIFNAGATFANNNRTVGFNGTIQQTVSGTQLPIFANLVIDNSNGVILAQNITVSSSFTFTNGKFDLSGFNASLGTAAIYSYDSNKYFVTSSTGYLIRNVGSAEVIFPVGATSVYAPAYLTQSATQEDLYVRVKQGIDNATLNDDFIVNLQWTIDEQTLGSNNITTKFQWNSTDENTFFDNSSNVKIGRYISAAYTTADASVSGTDPYSASASAMSDDISAEIPFIVGNTIAFSANGYKTAQNGDWNTGTTWVGGVVPPVNAECYILHHITVAALTNDANAVTIYADKSVTFNTNGQITVNGNLINYGMLKTDDVSAIININGTLHNKNTASVNMVGNGILNFSDASNFINEGSFTAGMGIVNFLGAGTASGALVFNDLTLSGGDVDLGANASVNNILTLSGTGNLITNSIIYAIGSTLKFDRNFSLATDKIWYSNLASTGVAQEGIPWNVEIASGVVNISDGFYRAINGNITITGTFELSTTSGGDLKLQGNFIDNGTFTHNNRFVEFNGVNNQIISGSPVFQDLVVNNSANITLSSGLTIANNLNFAMGNVIIGNYNLNLSIGATISNYATTKYVVTNGNGYLIQNINTSASAFYPVGTLSGYNPANLSQGASATQDDFGIRVQNSIENTVNDPTQVVNVQWILNEGTIDGNDLTTQFYWNGTDEAGSFNRASGTVETRYYTAGAYSPIGPPYSSIAGSDPYDATSGYVINYAIAGGITNMPFIVADASAFTGGIISNGTGGGNWNNTATWQAGVIPVSGNSVIIKTGDVVSLDVSPTVKSVSVQTSGTLNCNTYTITLDNGGALANSGTFNANTGKIVFSGTGSISTGSILFNDVDLNGAVSFGSNTTINGTLSINSSGSVNINPPKYSSSSILKYNQSGSVTRGSEWQYNISQGDPGYPANVTITNNTTFDVDADDNDDNYYNTRFMSGDLVIDAGSEITLSNMGGNNPADENAVCGLYVEGSINNSGTINLSSVVGGDMMLDGNLTNSGTVNWNGRAVFFTGDVANQYITGITQIPFILITRGSKVFLNNNLEVNGSGSEFITFACPSSTKTGSIDLNSYTLSCTGDGNIELNDIAGAVITGTGRVEVAGGDATFSGTGSGTLSMGADVTLAINGGIMTFPSTLGIVTIYGTLEIGDAATITNIPTYGNNSTLHYKKGGSYTMGVEWGVGSNIADNIPFNVTISQGSTSSVMNMNANRYALGTLLIESNATLEVANATGQLTVNNITVDAGGKIVLKSPSDNGVAGSFISTGTVTNNGTMQAERYVSAWKYTYISPPNTVTNSQIFTNNTSGTFNPNFYYYNQAYEAPSDPTSGTYADWSDVAYGFTNAWVKAHDGEGGTGIILDVPGRGYAYYNDVNKLFVFDGTYTTGNQSVTLYYDDNDNDNLLNGGYFDGWNLIANPFPSALDWEDASWDKTNVDGTIYYWDGTFGTGGNYKYYNSSVYDDGTNIVNGGSQFIPASQAFFVKAKSSVGAGGQALIIPNNARKHNAQDFWGKSAKSESKTVSSFIRLETKANNLKDELVLRYIPEANVGYDSYFDAYKIYTNSVNVPQIYSYNELLGAGYAINSLPLSSLQTKTSIGLEIAKSGETECSIALTEYAIESKHIYLEDILENTVQNLLTNPEYSFIIPDSSDIRERFYISYEDNAAPYINGNISDYDVDFNNSVVYPISSEIFYDDNIGDKISYEALLINNENLPSWLNFDRNTQTFYGTPEKAESFIIKIIAADIFGQTVSSEFLFTVNAVLAEVNTVDIVEVLPESAIISGELISSGGVDIESVGICWSTSSNPTIENDYSTDILNNNQFTGVANNLLSNTTYYVRSYAKNSVGIQYGNQFSFTTLLSEQENVEKDVISISPNPTSGIISISNNNNEDIHIKVFNVNGQIMASAKINKAENKHLLDFTYLPAGLYFIQMTSCQNTKIQKLIIK